MAKIIGWRPRPLGLAPSLGNPGPATVNVLVLCISETQRHLLLKLLHYPPARRTHLLESSGTCKLIGVVCSPSAVSHPGVPAKS